MPVLAFGECGFAEGSSSREFGHSFGYGGRVDIVGLEAATIPSHDVTVFRMARLGHVLVSTEK